MDDYMHHYISNYMQLYMILHDELHVFYKTLLKKVRPGDRPVTALPLLRVCAAPRLGRPGGGGAASAAPRLGRPGGGGGRQLQL